DRRRLGVANGERGTAVDQQEVVTTDLVRIVGDVGEGCPALRGVFALSLTLDRSPGLAAIRLGDSATPHPVDDLGWIRWHELGRTGLAGRRVLEEGSSEDLGRGPCREPFVFDLLREHGWVTGNVVGGYR